MNWYRNEKVNEHITRIIDIAGVACYLIEGTDTACLLDTCCGYGDLREYVGTLTEKEIFVILTHGHYDHTGSASHFKKIYMNYADFPVLNKHNQEREYFLNVDKKSIAALKAIEMKHLNPLYTKTPFELNDGQMFDLGGLTLEMIEVRGHTPGMMCALLKEDRVMFYGDACGMNVLLHDEFASDVSEYLASLEKLKAYDDQYDTVLRNHGSYTNSKDLLDHVMDCCRDILNHTDDHHPIQMFGGTLYEAKERINGNRKDGGYGNVIYAADKQQ